ncbi:hypothetical protein CTAYLR_000944 [Chrysophaeum taylorii]|uniref:EF-hand domain-containing protein n=1 Tax=Chrysophaeum taylorii TaxID=2483200 RepID=A0AAD7UFV6_9STRA|nr:hypothetical protein CTAYLR_000944 [Chrysophaeum taylorii]
MTAEASDFAAAAAAMLADDDDDVSNESSSHELQSRKIKKDSGLQRAANLALQKTQQAATLKAAADALAYSRRERKDDSGLLERAAGSFKKDADANEKAAEVRRTTDSLENAAMDVKARGTTDSLEKAAMAVKARSTTDSLENAAMAVKARGTTDSLENAAMDVKARGTTDSLEKAAMAVKARSTTDSLENAAMAVKARGTTDSLEKAAMAVKARSTPDSLENAAMAIKDRSTTDSLENAAVPVKARSTTDSLENAAVAVKARCTTDSLENAAMAVEARDTTDSLQNAAMAVEARDTTDSLQNAAEELKASNGAGLLEKAAEAPIARNSVDSLQNAAEANEKRADACLLPKAKAIEEKSAEETRVVEKGTVPLAIVRKSVRHRWYEGDEVQTRRGATWTDATVVRGGDEYVDVSGEASVPISRLRPRPAVVARACAASAALLRSQTNECDNAREALAKIGARVDERRGTARIRVETLTVTLDERVSLDQCSPSVVVVTSPTKHLRVGDEVIRVDGVSLEELACREDIDISAAVLAGRVLMIRRVEIDCLSRREIRALEQTRGVRETPRGGESDMAVVVDAVAAALHRINADGSPDPGRAFDEVPHTPEGLRRYLASLSLVLYAPGYGAGGERDDGVGRPAVRPMSARQAHTLVAHFFAEGVSEKAFTDFVFGPPRPLDELRELVAFVADGKPEWLFERLDRDGNGVLGRAELAHLATLGLPLLPAEIDALVAALDTDGDGVTGLPELRAFLGLAARVVDDAAHKRDDATLAEYIAYCEELKDENARLRQIEESALHDDTAWPLLERWLGGLNNLVAMRALAAADGAWRACKARAALAAIAAAEARDAARGLASATEIKKLRAQLREHEDARARAESNCVSLKLALERHRCREHDAQPRADTVKPPRRLQKQEEEESSCTTAALLKARAADIDNLRHQLCHVTLREQGAIKAWRQASKGRDELRSELRDVEVRYQHLMREAQPQNGTGPTLEEDCRTLHHRETDVSTPPKAPPAPLIGSRGGSQSSLREYHCKNCASRSPSEEF